MATSNTRVYITCQNRSSLLINAKPEYADMRTYLTRYVGGDQFTVHYMLEVGDMEIEAAVVDQASYQHALATAAQFLHLQIKSDVEIKPVAAAVTGMVCQLCMQQILEADVFELSCAHKFCNQCMQRYLETQIRASKLKTQPTCPFLFCSARIHKRNVRAVVRQDTWELYDNYVQTSQRFLVECAKTDCRHNNVVSKKDLPFINCQKCGFEFCAKCKKLPHPDMDCSTAALIARASAYMEDGRLLVQCPVCTMSFVIPHPGSFTEGTFVQCSETNCNIKFFICCAAQYTPVIAHGSHYHRPNCSLFKPAQADHQDMYLPDICDACRKDGKLCPTPSQLKYERLITAT